jgi:hypothetical protein
MLADCVLPLRLRGRPDLDFECVGHSHAKLFFHYRIDSTKYLDIRKLLAYVFDQLSAWRLMGKFISDNINKTTILDINRH